MTEPNYYQKDLNFTNIPLSTKYKRNTISHKKRSLPKIQSNDDEFQILLKNFKKAILGFYTVSKGNFKQMNNLFSYQTIQNDFYTISSQQTETNDLVNSLKTIIQTNNNNLQNFFNDSNIILRNLEIERLKTNKKYYNIISHLSKNNNERTSLSPKNINKSENKNIYNNLYNNIYNTNDNINNNINKNRCSTPKLNRLHKNVSKGNLTIKMYLAKLNDFNGIIGSFSPQLKNSYIQIRNGLQKEIENLMSMNKSNSTKNIFLKSGNNFYRSNNSSYINGNTIDSKDNKNQIQYNELMKKYKLQKQNYENIVNDLSCQLESLKTYSETLEKTLEEKNIEKNSYENNENNKVSNKILMNFVNENKKLTENNLELKTEMEKIKSQNELLNKKITQNKSSENNEEITSLKKEIELYKVQIKNNEKQILVISDQLTNDIKEYEKTTKEKEKIIKDLENKINKLQNENKKITEEKTKLEKLISNNPKEKNINSSFGNNNLFMEMQELEFIPCTSVKNKNEAEKLNKKYDEEIKKLRNKIEYNNNMLQEKEDIIIKLKTENQKILTEKDQLITEINNLKNNDSSFNSRKSQKKISKSHLELTQKLQETETELEKEKNEKEGLKCFIDKLQKEKEIYYENNNINGGDKEKELTKENKKLKQQIEHLSITFPQEMEELRRENKSLTEKVKKLKLDIENGNSKNNNVDNK